MKSITIYLDFDGTMTEHAFPELGAENPGALKVVSQIQKAGHNIVLNTYRANMNDGSLELAIEYLNNSPLEKIEKVETQKIHPQPWDPASSYKQGQIFIDDIADQMPLRPNISLTEGQMVDWPSVEKELLLAGLL